MGDLYTDIIKAVLAIATPVIATLVSALIVQLLRKKGFELDAEKTAKLEYITTQVVLRAEEWAASRLKGNAGPTTGAMKLERAMSDLADKVPNISREDAAASIHATLPKMGLGASSVESPAVSVQAVVPPHTAVEVTR